MEVTIPLTIRPTKRAASAPVSNCDKRRQRTCRNLSPFATAHLPPFAAFSRRLLSHGRLTPWLNQGFCPRNGHDPASVLNGVDRFNAIQHRASAPGMPSAPRESPFDCVARCASSRSFRRYARRLPPMTMLASPEVRQAIMDSRGKCRSRWLGHHTEMRGRSADTSRPVQVSGHGWFTDGLRSERGHSRRGHGRGHGLFTDTDCARPRRNSGRGCGHGLDAGTARSRTGHGPGSDTDCPWLRTSARPFGRTDCGFTATVLRTQKPRFHEE